MRRRIRLAPVVAVLGALAGALTPAPASALPSDDIVPAGTVLVQAKVTAETQRDGIANDALRHPLLWYLEPNHGIREQLTGTITRRVTTADLLLGVGLTDTWNLNLIVPHREIEQTSSVSTASADPKVQAALNQLQTRTVSGMGNVSVASLHRSVFDDTNGLVLKWGATLGGNNLQTPFSGRTTLDVQQPNDTFDAGVHYTRYPLGVPRGRFDIEGSFHLGMRTRVETPDDRHVIYQPFNMGTFQIRWGQEGEAFGYALFLRHEATTQAFLAGSALHDQTKETRAGMELMFGNLSALEQHPLALPYQLGLQVDHLLLGFNVPEANRVTFTARFYY